MSSNFKDFLNVYDFTVVLEGSGEEIHFKPLVTKQLKKLLVLDSEGSAEQSEQVLDEIITGCVLNKDFNVDDLYLLDRISLLFEIRKKSKGEKIDSTKICNSCGLETVFEIDLNSIEKKKFVKNDEFISVAGGNINLKLDHLKRKDQKAVMAKIKKTKNKREESFEVNEALLAQSITCVKTAVGEETNISFEDKVYIVDNLSTQDLTKISSWHQDNAFGINFKYKFKCAHCNHTEEIDIPLNDFLS